VGQFSLFSQEPHLSLFRHWRRTLGAKTRSEFFGWGLAVSEIEVGFICDDKFTTVTDAQYEKEKISKAINSTPKWRRWRNGTQQNHTAFRSVFTNQQRNSAKAIKTTL
jgi:hypothetical protein